MKTVCPQEELLKGGKINNFLIITDRKGTILFFSAVILVGSCLQEMYNFTASIRIIGTLGKDKSKKRLRENVVI